MSTQHTPGPWNRNIRAGGKYPTAFAGRNQHVAVATQQKDPAETEANIDLIAAAPELLAALLNVVSAYEPNRHGVTPEWITTARAAIAKAEGK